VPANRITGIVKGTRGVTADTACRLSVAFDTTPEFWMNLQTQYEIEATRMTTGQKIVQEVHRLAA
jgi:addiction module HigA family antidote